MVVTRKKSKLKGLARLGPKSVVGVDKANEAVKKLVEVVVEVNEAAKKPAAVNDLSSVLHTIREEEEDVDGVVVVAVKVEAEF